MPLAGRRRALALERCVGSGATAKVWAGMWGGRSVAVKIMDIDEMYEEESLDEFRLECQGLRDCAHANVIRFYIEFVEREVGTSKMSQDIISEAAKLVWQLRFSRHKGRAGDRGPGA